MIYLEFLQPELTVHENDSNASVCLELQQAYIHIESDIWVNFTTADNSALGMEISMQLTTYAPQHIVEYVIRVDTHACIILYIRSFEFCLVLSAEEDFERTSATESLSAGSVPGDQVCVNVPLIDDDSFEKTEYFILHVELEENVMIHGSSDLSIHIYDNDGGFTYI